MIIDTDSILKSDVIPMQAKDQLRSFVTYDYINFFKRNKQLTSDEKQINHLHLQTKKFMKEHPNIYVINSDKGQKSVIIDKDMYEEKMSEHLNDTNTYIPLPNSKLDINAILEKKVNDEVTQLHILKQMNENEKRDVLTNNSIPPRIYGAIKTHKQNHPIRPIVSTINCPTYKLSKFLNNILSNVYSTKYNIKNAFELKEIIGNLSLDDNDRLISFDVVALYTNVSQDEAIESVMKRWSNIRSHTTISKQNFKNLLELCVKDSSYFIYNNITYRQKYGLAMGNSLSGTLATFVLDDLIDANITINKPKLIVKYIDDLLIIDNEANTINLFNKLNSSHNSIKFTMEKENEGKLPYLDLQLIREDNKIMTDWYRKDTSSGRILNWLSNHPFNMKMNIVISLANRVLKLSHQQFHNKNYKIIVETLTNNNFPPNIIKRIINKSKHHQTPSQNISTSQSNQKIYRSLPYIPTLTESISKDFKKINPNINFGVRPMRKLRNDIFTNTKTRIQRKKQGHVYKINCNGKLNEPCQFTYIGESGRVPSNKNNGLKGPRIKEHCQDFRSETKKREAIVKERLIQYENLNKKRTRNKAKELDDLKKLHEEEDKNRTFKNAILNHAMMNQHTFDFDNTTILHFEDNIARRKALESAYIYKEGPAACNDKQDTQYLNIHTRQILSAWTCTRNK